MTWPPTTTYLWTAFSAHVAWALLAIVGCLAFGFEWWYGAVGILAVALLKETLVDPYLEGNPLINGTSLDSGWFDLTGYVIGVLFGVLVLFGTHKIL